MNKILFVSLLLALSAALAQAAPPTTINFQGSLQPAGGGSPVDGNYTVIFSLYPQAVGGFSVWTETQSVPVVGGQFDTVLGAVNALTVVPFDAPYWLGIKVGDDPELAPRVALTAVPYAMNVADHTVVNSLQGLQDDVTLVAGSGINLTTSGQNITIESSGGGTADADWQVVGSTMTSLPTGNVGIGVPVPMTKLNVNGAIRAGTQNTSGQIQATAGTGAIASALYGNKNGQGGQLELMSENGVANARIEPDGSGQGGLMTLMHDNVNPGVILDGVTGSGASLSLIGDTTIVELRSDINGDGAVFTPIGAINPVETSAEAGAASATAGASGALGLTTTVSALASRTIVAPANGFVMAMSSCEVTIDLFNNTTFTTIGLTEDPNVLPANQDINVYLSSAIGNGLYIVPQSNTALFPVNAGNNTIYLSGSKNNTTPCTVRDIQLTLVFIPTAYGTIQTASASESENSGPEQPDGLATRSPLTGGEIAAERAESEAFYQQQLAAEMRNMQTRLAEMQQQIETSNTSPSSRQ